MKREIKTKWTIVVALLCLFAYIANAQKAIILPQDYAVVSLQSTPSGADVYLGEKLVGTTPCTIQIPYKGIIMPGKKKDLAERMLRSAEASSIKLTFVKDGYVKGKEVLTPLIVPNNKTYKFQWPKTILHEFSASKEKDTTIPAGEAQRSVSRDRAGKTALERTIIRWYFDSAPQGARVFWRVISSVPDQVKNTNELWLGTTPFEETRSFNIQGLTYENSRDVQIEVKVKCKGYVEQNKRFNVRQAIDQQEISSFFDLVEE